MAGGFDPTQLSDLDHRLATAWRAAEDEFGIRVAAPFDLPTGNATFRYGALVVGFGSVNGTLLRAMPDEFHPDQCGAIWAAAREAGYEAANLSPLLCRFDRGEFTQFLNLFPWCGLPEERPPWHTGPADLGPSVGPPDDPG
jgi:hypothetical protein